MDSRPRRKVKRKKFSDKKCQIADPLPESSNFDESFKYYKQRVPLPDLCAVVNPTFPELWESHGIKRIRPETEILEDNDFENSQVHGLIHPSSWTILTFNSHPGLIYIVNPFTSQGQQAWIQRSLKDYTKKPPYKLNLDAHPEWQVGNGLPDWWEMSNRDEERSSILKKKLRWSTLGYHHDWDTKVYSEENRSNFPEELADLSKIVAATSGFQDFTAEAAIVNFYHFDSTLAGHIDHSEEDFEAPLLSFSFGQNAIFLLGSTNKNDHPLALLIQSGDIVIMSGPCRLSYHGVPRIEPISEDLPRWKGFEVEDETEDWKRCCEYLQWSRINLNVRQVKRKL
ncbi:nucleic acid dioxygenase ALKBH1 [Neocloeon triangulifer]|uniref:nucleic acid dioxygenase ALKBH1 n=1 Tax=Neocloeon triangulifer TaxID=2078957 RepID=UPI00286F42BA|nr:nucleic acid dioxygenase ALKBH1 [Neocloeon triangulifer]